MASASLDSQPIQVDDESQTTKAVKSKGAVIERVPGRSLFPVARVQKILKADKDLDGIAKEAVFIVAMATERFIQRMSEAARAQAGREKRATVQRKDILTVTRREEEYFFLGDILDESSKLNFKKGEDKKGQKDGSLLEAFGQKKKEDDDEETHEVDEDEGRDEETQDAELETQSEAVSLPPSSRPSSPRSVGDQSEPADFEMDDED